VTARRGGRRIALCLLGTADERKEEPTTDDQEVTQGQGHQHGHAHGHGHDGHRFDPERLLAREDRFRALFDPARHLLPMFAGDERVVLDVGAGVGLLALALAEHLPGASVVAIDRQDDMVAVLERRLREAGRSNARALQADAAALPLPDASADAVLMSVVLHDFADPYRALGEARRVLRSGGRLVLIEVRPGATEDGPPQERLFQPERLARMLVDSGFTPGPFDDGPGPLYRVAAQRDDA